MSFPRYPAYKDSGVEWLGEVPEGWHVFALKRDIELLTSGSRGWAEHYADDGALFLRIGNLTRESIDLDLLDVQHVEVPEVTEGQRTRVQPGDLLFSITAYLGSVGVVPDKLEEAYVSQHVALVRLKGGLLSARWVAYVTLSTVGKTYLALRGYGGTKIQLSLDDVAELPIPKPSLLEQGTIVTFLDRETAKIDALVAEYRTLIDLLQEKRQAVISHAVTKGLDPTVPMKDSGVKWLGEVPEAWSVCALNYRYDVALGKMLDEKRITGNHLAPYLRNVDVQWGCINVGDLPEMDFEGNDLVRYGLVIGDLLVCEGGEVGRAAIWQGALTECYYQKALHRVRPRSKQTDNPQFLYYVLAAAASLSVFAESEGKSTISHLPAEAFRRYQFAFPPRVEQTAIAVFLDGKTTELDSLITDAKEAITLLQERRTALISAAVTGKIDVRGLVAEAPQVAIPETNLAISQP